jgi:diacylglycerol kinase
MPAPSLLESFRCAGKGLWYALSTQRNAKIHASAAVIVMVIAVWLEIPVQEMAVLALTVSFVFAFELLNTMVETLVDLVSPGPHPLARAAKDVAAGAVLVSAGAAVVIGILILGPPLLSALGY